MSLHPTIVDEETSHPQNNIGLERDSPMNETASSPKGESSAGSKHYIYAFCVLLIGGIAGIAAGMSSGNSSPQASEFDLLDPSTWFSFWANENPHGGNSPYDFNIWDNHRSCRGLKLDIIDNLEPKWDSYFQRSIKEWENDNNEDYAPDVLTLRVRKSIRFDPNCDAILGKMVVCNGDYGETDYIGINNVAIQYGFIISSVALLNDYFLEKGGDALKQNTMCHEIGHGFGLGHWDENFYNRDLGNCMDYTNSPENNQSPARSNFLFLEQMYGNTYGTSQYIKEGYNGIDNLHCTPGSEVIAEELGTTEIFKRRQLSTRSEITQDEFSRIATLMQPGHIIVDPTLDEHPLVHEGWRYLKRTDKFEVHEQDLGDGLKIISTVHLA